MTLRFRHLFIASVLGGLVASALPAAAAQVGDAFGLGEVNAVNATTSLRGDVDSANLVIRNDGSGVPLSLKNNSGGVPNGKAPMKVDSRRLVKNLNVDQLDFRHANELNRAAYENIYNAPDANGAAATATITAPKPGILIMGGSIEARGSNDTYNCQLSVDLVSLDGSFRRSSLSNPGGDHTDNREEDCSTDGGTVVAAGDHTVALVVTGRESAILEGASVWVIWVPFDGDGNIPTP